MKKIYSLILTLALLLPVLAGCQNSEPAAKLTDPPVTLQPSATTESTVLESAPPPVQTDAPPETTAPVESTNKLTRDEAIDIALKDAGLTKDQVRDLEAELDRDNGVLHYDVDFEKDNKDYDYEIHAETGQILRKEIPVQTSAQNPAPQKQLTREEARDIALKHAGFTANQVRDLESELDRDDGKLHYDVDFEKDGYDYSYEIDAATGSILRSEKERD